MRDDAATEIVFSGNIIRVRVDTIVESGNESRREVVESSEVSTVLALSGDDNTQICLVDQYRHPVGRRMLEIPAGRIDPGETAEECARRELAEETGYRAGEWTRLGSFYSSPGFCTERVHVFAARRLERMKEPPDGDEHDLRVRWLPISAVLGRQDWPLDGKTLAALLLWRERNCASLL